MNIAQILCLHAEKRPDATAILDFHHGRDRSISFAGLALESSRAAALLKSKGVEAGDAVLIFHPMSAELYAALIGSFRLGAIPMFLDPSSGREHMERCCKMWPPKALLASTKVHLLRFVSPALRAIPVKLAIGPPCPATDSWSSTRNVPPLKELFDCAADSPALITFTSGSTGMPKAAVRTHGFLLEQHRVLAQNLGLTPGDVDLTTLPIFVIANLGSGVCSLIAAGDLKSPGAIEPAPIVRQIQTHKPKRAVASPAFLERLADFCAVRQLKLPELENVFVGGAPVFPNLLRKIHGVAPKAAITALYGSTEAEPIAEAAYSEMQPPDLDAMVAGRGLLAGLSVPQIRLSVIQNGWGAPLGPFTASGFESLRVSVGEPGEIVVSGAHVLPGYLHACGDAETKFDVDGVRWHRTGDAGYLDERGRLWLLGRCEALIHDSRGVLYPFSVECAAMQIPGVRRAALIAHVGRRLLALELHKGANPDTASHVREAICWAEVESVIVLKKIPVDKRHNSKVNYMELRRVLGH